MSEREHIQIHGQELQVIVGPKGGGYIEAWALCKAAGLHPPTHIAKLKKDPEVFRRMKLMDVPGPKGASREKYCLPLRMVLEDFYGREPLSKSTSGYITRKELLKLYGFAT